MIVVGWGKKGNKVGYVGINKCPKCKNYAHFSLYELVSNVKLYFVTVAKFNKKRYMVCEVCDTGYELNEDQFLAFTQESLNNFDRATTDQVWDYIADRFSELTEQIDTSDPDRYENIYSTILNEITNIYGNEENATKIMAKYFECLLDDDKAK